VEVNIASRIPVKRNISVHKAKKKIDPGHQATWHGSMAGMVWQFVLKVDDKRVAYAFPKGFGEALGLVTLM
jgi:hypothetical protein